MVVIKIQAFKGLGKSFWLRKLENYLKSEGWFIADFDNGAHLLIASIAGVGDHDFVPKVEK